VFALALMTALSALMGAIAPNLLNKTTTHYVATGLFFLFGLRSIYDQTIGYDADAESELEEVEKELKLSSSSVARRTRSSTRASTSKSTKKKQSGGNAVKNMLSVFFSPIFLQAFLMTFLAEWGDRSQIATIALAADYDPIGVTLGGICGHGLCTSAAVLGGKRMAGAISERMVGLCGGVLFLAFGVHALVVGE
jgi:putative Ca2+/H+ antiporter (TMEM165/GDT1 family)